MYLYGPTNEACCCLHVTSILLSRFCLSITLYMYYMHCIEFCTRQICWPGGGTAIYGLYRYLLVYSRIGYINQSIWV